MSRIDVADVITGAFRGDGFGLHLPDRYDDTPGASVGERILRCLNDAGLVVRPASEPKPNGWHTYHVCSGQLQEITGVSQVGEAISALFCPACGEWFEASVRPEGGRR